MILSHKSQSQHARVLIHSNSIYLIQSNSLEILRYLAIVYIVKYIIVTSYYHLASSININPWSICNLKSSGNPWPKLGYLTNLLSTLALSNKLANSN